jgi:hypothetical protein
MLRPGMLRPGTHSSGTHRHGTNILTRKELVVEGIRVYCDLEISTPERKEGLIVPVAMRHT